jgi:hypothetical protein
MKIISFFSFLRVMGSRWNEIDRGKPKYSGGGGGRTCPRVTSSTTNPTWTERGSIPGLRDERQGQEIMFTIGESKL